MINDLPVLKTLEEHLSLVHDSGCEQNCSKVECPVVAATKKQWELIQTQQILRE